MEEKLFEKGESIEVVANKVNNIVNSNFSILDEDDNDIEKWTSIPKLLLLDTTEQNKFLSFVNYMDSSYLSIKQKALVIISLSGLIEYKKIKIANYDEGSLYLLADYYQNSSFASIDKTYEIISNDYLLSAVRKKTLDPEERKNLLSMVEKNIFNDKIDNTDANSVKEFIKKQIREIDKIKY